MVIRTVIKNSVTLYTAIGWTRAVFHQHWNTRLFNLFRLLCAHPTLSGEFRDRSCGMAIRIISDPISLRREIEASFERCRRDNVNPEDRWHRNHKCLSPGELSSRLIENRQFVWTRMRLNPCWGRAWGPARGKCAAPASVKLFHLSRAWILKWLEAWISVHPWKKNIPLNEIAVSSQ